MPYLKLRFRQENSPAASHLFNMDLHWLSGAGRLGILGGTFDPIHYGHLAIAEEARVRFALNAVLFIPAGEPPHKPTWQADAEQRWLMVTLATADHPHFFVSRMEIERGGRSYSVETLRALHDALPQSELFFIIGGDSALDFHHWREPHEIARLARVVAATRPGYPLDTLQQPGNPFRVGMEIMPVPGLDISSTALRARIGAGASTRYLIPDVVAAYIAKHRLYARTSPDGQATSV